MIHCQECGKQHWKATLHKHGGCPNRPKLWECSLCPWSGLKPQRHRGETGKCPVFRGINLRTGITHRDGREWAALYARYRELINKYVPAEGIHLIDLYRTIRTIEGPCNTMALTLNDLLNGPLYRMGYRWKRKGKGHWDIWIYRPGDERGAAIGYTSP